MKLMNMERIVCPCLAVLLSTALASAQGDTGFLRGKGHADVALSWTLDTYDKFWDGNDLASPAAVGRVERETGSLYAAYGLCDDIDLVVNANYVEAETDGTDATIQDEEDLQDLYLGAKWRLWSHADEQSSFSTLVAPSIKLPMTDYENSAVTALGDGQVDLRLRLIAHYQYGGFWGSVESGYDRRNGPPHDEVPVNITLGGTVAGWLTLMPFYSTVESLGGIDISDVGVQGGFPATEEQFSRVGLSVFARACDWCGVSAMVRTTLNGMNTGDADAFSLGLVLRL
jgi:hypothetical protein